MSCDRTVYVVSVDFDRLLGSLVNSTGLHIRRAVVVEDDGPLYYDGPIQLRRDEDGEGFKLLTAELAGEVLPHDIDGWRMVMQPGTRALYLSENGYYRIAVYDTLKGAVQ